METKVIKISKENYDWLLSVATRMREEEKRTVTFDDALNKIKKQRISDLAGSWKISENESKELINEITRSRESWRK